jgi:hypothetical protein
MPQKSWNHRMFNCPLLAYLEPELFTRENLLSIEYVYYIIDFNDIFNAPFSHFMNALHSPRQSNMKDSLG